MTSRRAGWKMRRTVEKFREPSKSDPSALIPHERLECGHVITDPDWTYGNEKAVAIAAVGRAIRGEGARRRCHECGWRCRECGRKEAPG